MKRLVPLLVVKAVLALLFIATGILGLGPDEAQYWTWSQKLDWGYYSKPPGIAWQIWLGTQIFGNTELGVRFLAVVINFLTSLSIYYLARSCRLKESTAFWAAVCFAFSPLGLLGSFLATTDGGLVLFWSLACVVMARALSQGKAPNYLLLGLLIACGALFKWPIYLFWLFVLFSRGLRNYLDCFLALFPSRFGLVLANHEWFAANSAPSESKKSLRKPLQIISQSPLAMIPFSYVRSASFFWGIALSLLGLLPSVVWNAQHDFATFQHVFSTIKGGHASIAASGGNFWDFIGAQAALLSPVPFILLIAAILAMLRRPAHIWPSLLFCGNVSTLLLVVYSFMALNQKMQGNWVVFAYPTGIVLAAWYAVEHAQEKRRRWLKGGIAASLILAFAILCLPFTGFLPYGKNPFKHNLGWDRMEKELAKAGYQPGQEFLFGDKYQMSSLLSFYSPGQKQAYFINLQGARKNQFSYWPSLREEQMGKDGYFVLVESSPQLSRMDPEVYRKQLSPYFSNVQVINTQPLVEKNGKMVKGMLIIKCLGYNGLLPDEGELY